MGSMQLSADVLQVGGLNPVMPLVQQLPDLDAHTPVIARIQSCYLCSPTHKSEAQMAPP